MKAEATTGELLGKRLYKRLRKRLSPVMIACADRHGN